MQKIYLPVKYEEDVTSTLLNNSVILNCSTNSYSNLQESSVSKKRGLDGSVVFPARETNVNRYPFVDNDEVMIMDDERFPSSPKLNRSGTFFHYFYF